MGRDHMTSSHETRARDFNHIRTLRTEGILHVSFAHLAKTTTSKEIALLSEHVRLVRIAVIQTQFPPIFLSTYSIS